MIGYSDMAETEVAPKQEKNINEMRISDQRMEATESSDKISTKKLAPETNDEPKIETKPANALNEIMDHKSNNSKEVVPQKSIEDHKSDLSQVVVPSKHEKSVEDPKSELNEIAVPSRHGKSVEDH